VISGDSTPATVQGPIRSSQRADENPPGETWGFTISNSVHCMLGMLGKTWLCLKKAALKSQCSIVSYSCSNCKFVVGPVEAC
jgi:hypothetical protein